MKSGVFNEQLRMIFNQVIEPWGAPTITITPLFYQGVIAGSEFLTYNVNKLYLCLGLQTSCLTGALASNAYIYIYNEANALSFHTQNGGAAWDATAAAFKYYSNDAQIRNLYFSRILGAGQVYMKFSGYRINR